MRPAELSVVVLTGAGISADSGVATFRGPGGLWEGQRIEDVATPAAWARDPAQVWRFYQLRRAALTTVAPNPAHHALVELERRLAAAGARFTLVTQNVDDLHGRAGSTRLLHMHGELALLRCERCEARTRDLAQLDPAAFAACSACGHPRLRPDVVWFGEVPYHLDEIAAALARCTHFAAIGTSGVVYPAAGMLAEARAAGARTSVLALERPENAHPTDEFVPGRACESVPRWVRAWLGEWGL
ncbi:MAG TPA: NAD-dependent deacylase [Planctomycetota bacterium]